MIYRWKITTPANTTEANAEETILQLGRGIIHKLDIVFPPGAQQLHHIQISRAKHQVWPTNIGESFASDGEPITFREALIMDQEPYQLEVKTWNDDDTYDHALLIRIGLLRKKFIMPWLVTWREKMGVFEE